jgi:alpha-glucosidase
MEEIDVTLVERLKVEDKHLWWQSGIVYQIYPRSFQDSNGDGIGDLKGIEDRLDYLEWLGVTAIWISPIYPSPMADFGYDVSDYCGIHPIFGTMEDFDRLLEAVHRRGMRVILDFVPNHTSDEHPWFIESRSSRDNPKRDWYIWKDPKPDGSPPNNWVSVFGGPAWEMDEHTGQYYYHAFLKEQPDLNWRNPEVQEAMLGAMRFWLSKGVDGFRVDVMWHMVKDQLFRDNPPNPEYHEGTDIPYHRVLPVFSTDQPEVHDIVRMMRRLTDEYGERVLIGEIYLPIQKLITYYGQDLDGAHLPFNFQLITLPWDAAQINLAVSTYEGQLPPGGWPNWVLGNHDKSRIASRVGTKQARVAAMLLLTLRGTPTMYYGDEIGMADVPIPPELVQDPPEKNFPGLGMGRDPERTPMQWDDSPNAGFSGGQPWLPLAEDYRVRNVEAQRNDPYSMLAYYRRLIGLRQSERALCVGAYEPVRSNENIVAYLRDDGRRKLLVALNLTHEPQELPLEMKCRILLNTELEREGEEVSDRLRLTADEGIIAEVL